MKLSSLLKLFIGLFSIVSSETAKSQIVKSVNWAYNSPKQLQIKTSGKEAEIMPAYLLESRILPNQASKQLLHALNKGVFDNNADVSSGSTIMLPVFPAIKEEQKTQFNEQYRKDMWIDENQNAVFLDRIGYFNKLLANVGSVKNSKLLNDQLIDVKRVFSIVQKMGLSLKFKSVQVRMLNNEIDDFNDSLIAILSRRSIEKRDVMNSKYFNEDMCNLINPLLGDTGIKRVSLKINTQYFADMKRQNGPYIDINDPDDVFGPEETTDEVEPAIPVCFYVFEADGKPSDAVYWVYCVPQRPYNQFINKGRDLKSLDRYKAMGKASTAFQTLETSFPRYFFAVSDDGVMSEAQLFEVYKIPKDTNPGAIHPYSFPIYMAKNN